MPEDPEDDEEEQWQPVQKRTYVVERDRRFGTSKNTTNNCRRIFFHIAMWIFHDIPIGTFEFVTSTSIFLVRTITKPFRVLWAMLGVYLEIKGLLKGTPVAGTWASFIESDDTIPFTTYIFEFSIPMALGISIFVIVVPNISAVMAIPPFKIIFSTQGKLIIIAATMILLGLLPGLVSLFSSILIP
jgi:hypothetical protein